MAQWRPEDWTVLPSGCWDLPGRKTDSSGYIKVYVGGGRTRKKERSLHRLMFEDHVGPIDSRLVLHHLCGNKRCFNPEHLVAMTRAEHIRLHDHTHKGNPTCKRGHPKDQYRSYDTKYPRCRECHRLAMAARNKEKDHQ